MNESMLHSLMRLFAIIVSINRDVVHILARNFVETFLIQQFSRKLADKYLAVFDDYSRQLEKYDKGRESKKLSSLSVKILAICEQIVSDLHIRHRFLILLSLIRFSRFFAESAGTGSGENDAISDAVLTVSDGLLITREEFDNVHAFITDKFYNIPDRDQLLIISDDPGFQDEQIRHLQKDNLAGQIFVLRIRRADSYVFRYIGKARLENHGKYIFPRHVYLLPRGSAVKGEGITPIYYSDIVSGFITRYDGQGVEFLAEEIEFYFRNSPNGIHKFSFQGRSGQLVGIIGGSGAGKSTLLKVLSGSLELHGGNIYINGHHLDKEAEELEGMIGYIPQDDLLMEELTVYENLWFNARLCLDGYTPEEVQEAVTGVLNDLGLYEIRKLKVGSPLNKFISGGQRKRLNIALEMIRGSHILFVDEPTSGLSSTDSEHVVALLKEQTLAGKLVLANIHQPSSELFKQFDHLLVLDSGGYPVYSGNPVEGISYFKQLAERVDAGESECAACGNVNPEEILQIIEARDVDEYGEFTPSRKTPPEVWYRHYREKIESGMKFSRKKSWVPYNRFIVPGKLKQFIIFFQRNLYSKLADRQFMAIALLVTPLLAVILGFFSKYVSGDGLDPHRYLFSQNENLPAYLFMSVIVALFVGLIVAAEEIIRDRRILERESFLNLDRNAYLLSKVALLFLLSAIQMMLFVLIGNLIMEIRGLTFTYWLILFSTACFANLLGLNISDGLRSVVAIYVIVPFLLVPQILLAGVIVKFDRLHYRFASHEVVPVAGDLMTSRWAYEALVVYQFLQNRYQRFYNDIERLESNVTYDMQFLVPALIQEIEDAGRLFQQDNMDPGLTGRFRTIRMAFASIFLAAPYPGADRFRMDSFTRVEGEKAVSWLRDYQSKLSVHRERLTGQKDLLSDSLRNSFGGTEEFIRFRRDHYNDRLADLALNRNDLHKIVKLDGKLVRKMEPVYMYPSPGNGRAHFYASLKKIGDQYIPATTFNILAIWLMTIILFFTLRYSLLRWIIDSSGRIRRPG